MNHKFVTLYLKDLILPSNISTNQYTIILSQLVLPCNHGDSLIRDSSLPSKIDINIQNTEASLITYSNCEITLTRTWTVVNWKLKFNGFTQGAGGRDWQGPSLPLALVTVCLCLVI